MKKLISIILTAVIINLLIIYVFHYSNCVPSDKVSYWDNIASCICVVGIIASVIQVILYRKYLFKNIWLAICSIIIVVVGAIFPFMFIYFTSIRQTSNTVLMSEDYYYPPNEVHKIEHWEYSWGWGDLKYVNKKFICDSVEFALSGEKSNFKRDSIWVYFKKNGDTSKVEKYKNGQLISSVSH